VIRGQTDARHPPTQFRDLQCHSVAASLSPISCLSRISWLTRRAPFPRPIP
jgi:hypothetical protein